MIRRGRESHRNSFRGGTLTMIRIRDHKSIRDEDEDG